MQVMLRYRVESDQIEQFLVDARLALATLATRPGFLRGSIGQAIDEAGLMLVSVEFDEVGNYRRALSAYEVKLHAVPLLSRAIDEPSAFEVLHVRAEGHCTDRPSSLAPDGPRFS